jgi:hypothetical protein
MLIIITIFTAGLLGLCCKLTIMLDISSPMAYPGFQGSYIKNDT